MDESTGLFGKLICHISACMQPVIPGLVAGGLLKIITLLLSYTSIFVIFPDTQIILEAISSAPFYFLPISVAYTSAKHFDTDVISALSVVGTMLMPEFIALMAQERQLVFAGIPVYHMTYAYTVFPIIVLIYLMSILQRRLQKCLKGVWNDILLHLSVVLITSLAGIIVIGPTVGVISKGVLLMISWLQSNSPVLAWMIFDGTAPLQIMTGTHWIFVSLAIRNLGEYGVENGFMVGYFILTMSLTAIAFVVQLRSTTKKKKNMAISSLITVICTGTTEPVLFGICLSSRIAILSAIIAGAVAGIYQGIVTIHSYVYAFPTLFSIMMFQSNDAPGNLVKAIIAGGISFVVAFILMIFGYRDKKKN
jgi:phosphotransferase system  glucose/maltose/N-acetylglucosamine-specific IIC component